MDCRDWRIIEKLIQRLENVSDGSAPCNVLIPKKRLQIDTFPAILMYYNELPSTTEGFNYDQSTLDVVLVYTDGKDDENEAESYIERYRNVAADIRKAIMVDPSLQGECEHVHVESSQPGLFVDGDIVLESVITYLKISRVCNQYDPYL